MTATSATDQYADHPLMRLRAALDAQGLTGFLIPKADKHQGEYTPARDERLAWATGFAGSAGLAAVVGEKTALFVDGRYEIQAAEQVPTGLVDVVAIRERTPEDWLRQTVSTGARIGFDPWLHTEAQIEKLAEAVEAAGGTLEALDANPIDALWKDRPPAPASAARRHDEAFAGKSAKDKRTDVAATLASENLAAAVLTLPDSIAWLLNIRGADLPATPVVLAFAILGRDATVRVFTDPSRFDGPTRDALGNAVSIESWDDFEGALAGLAGARVAVEKTSAPVAVAKILENAGAEVVWRQDPTSVPKARKNAAEIDGARAAHLRDGAALSTVLAWIDAEGPKGTLRESDVVARLVEERRRAGAADDRPFLFPAFDTIAGFGPNGAIVHYRVTPETDRRIESGGLLLIDSGGQYVDGTTDVTRTVAIGAPSQQQRAAATLVLKGMIGISELAFPPKTTGREIDAFARIALWRAGLDFDHGTGHGVGSVLSVHEGPQNISRRGAATLEEGMITSNEPGYYRRGAFGVRIENLVLVRAAEKAGDPALDAAAAGGLEAERAMHRFETLTLAPIDRRLIEPRLLSAAERAWMDAYHARVLAALRPRVSQEVGSWLEQACAPLPG